MGFYLPDTSVAIAINEATSGTASFAMPIEYLDVFLPSAWTACTLRVQVSDNNSDWYNLGGTALVTGTTAASEALVLTIGGHGYVRLVCSTVQLAARTIKLRGWRV